MAREFKFRLEAFRRVRQIEFEGRQRIVADRLRKIGGEQAIIAALERELASMNDETKRLLSGGQVNIDGVCRYRLRSAYLREQVSSAVRRVFEHERELLVERAAMTQTSVAVKAIDKLKERRYAAHRLQLKQLEAVEQDETSLQIHRHKELLSKKHAGRS